jgi:hypothetical protein
MFENVLVTLADEGGPIGYGLCHGPTMYVVKWLIIHPALLNIVYFEMNIRWYPNKLGRYAGLYYRATNWIGAN